MNIKETTENTATTGEFLNNIHGPYAKIYFNVGGKLKALHFAVTKAFIHACTDDHEKR